MKILRPIQKWLLGACLTLPVVIAPVLHGAAGDLDPSFTPPLGKTKDWSWTAVPAGEQYYLLGLSLYYPGWQDIPADYLTRWNANGTRDNTFQASRLRGSLPGREYHGQWWGGVENLVNGMAVRDDGSLLILGYFGSPMDSSMYRYGSASFVIDSTGSGYPSPVGEPPGQNGSPDPAFEQLDFRVLSALLQPDGARLLGGEKLSSTSGTPLARLLADGSPDPSFTPATAISVVSDMALQADGKILIGSSSNPLVCRLNTDGSLDSSFKTLTNPYNSSQYMKVLSLLGDGRVLAGGIFTINAGAGAQTYAMLQNDPAISALEKADAATLRWRRGGSAPEVERVSFDHRAVGTADWTPLGAGVRIAGGWELRAADGLPVEGEVRARGWNPGNQSAGGWVEATLAVGVPLEEWRLHHFGSTQSTGDGADLADPDGDGFTNLIEYLFSSNPEAPSTSPVPAWTTSGSFLECRFSATPGLSPLTVSAQWTPDLTTPWETVQGQTEDSLHILKVPLNGNRHMFVRLKVSVP